MLLNVFFFLQKTPVKNNFCVLKFGFPGGHYPVDICCSLDTDSVYAKDVQ